MRKPHEKLTRGFSYGKMACFNKKKLFLIKKSKGIRGMGTQMQVAMKNKGSINIALLTMRPTSWWDSWPRDGVNLI